MKDTETNSESYQTVTVTEDSNYVVYSPVSNTDANNTTDQLIVQPEAHDNAPSVADSSESDSVPEEEIGSSPNKKSIKKTAGFALFLIFNIVVLFLTAQAEFSKEAPKYQGKPFGAESILFLQGAILCLVIVLAAETIKYILMMKYLGEKKSVRVAFETAALGKYYDSLTPSGAGGQPFQIWHLHSKGYSTGASSAMPLTGFVTMQFGFVILALIVVIFNNNAISAVPLKIAAYAGIFTYTIVPFMIVLSAIAPKLSFRIVKFFTNLGHKIHIIKNPEESLAKAEKALTDYSESLKKIGKNKLLLLVLFALSVLFQVALCSIPFFVIHVFGGNLGFIQSLSMTVFVYASVTLIPTPGNSGAAEGSFYILFNQLDTSGLFWAMLLWRFLCYYSFILIGLIVYGVNAIQKLLSRKKNKSDE